VLIIYIRCAPNRTQEKKFQGLPQAPAKGGLLRQSTLIWRKKVMERDKSDKTGEMDAGSP
jgi:hypothetical protein